MAGPIRGGYRLGKRIRSEGAGLAPGGVDRSLVYEATHERMPGVFAVRILDLKRVEDTGAVTAFRETALATAALRHPNIASVVDVDRLDDGRPFVVMERFDGVSLESRLRGDAALPLAEVVGIVKGIAAGLSAAHGLGVVHGDLYPGSVSLVQVAGHPGGFVKLLNFGAANMHPTSPLEGGHVRIMSDAHFMAPEQALGRSAAIGPHTDQFALGALAFRMLTGVDAFRGEDALGVMYQIAHQPPRSLSMRSICPPAVDAVLMTALAKEIDQRWPTVLAFARAFENACVGITVEADEATTDAVARVSSGTAGASIGENNGLINDPLNELAGIDDLGDVDDIDERVFRPKRGRGVAVFAVLAAMVGGAGVYLVGDELPTAWRSHALWHAMHLPHAVAPAETTAIVETPQPIVPTETVNPAVPAAVAASPAAVAAPPAAVAAPAAAVAAPPAPVAAPPVAAPPAPVAAPPVAAPPAPVAAPPAPVAAPPVAAPPAAVPKAVPFKEMEEATQADGSRRVVEKEQPARRAERREVRKARRSRRPPPERGFVWSDTLQRMVPMIPASP